MSIVEAAGKPKPSWKVEDNGDTAQIWSVGSAVRTVEDALAKAEIDTRIWEVTRSKINSWPTTMKLRDGDGDRVEQAFNWQVTVELKRRAPKPITDAIQELLADFRKSPPKLPKVKRRKVKDPHMLELALFDAHFGKLCWGAETGTDYDLRIAERVYVDAFDDLLARIAGYEIEKVLIPIGNDMFQVDNWQGTTAHGTVVDSVDDRFQKVFRAGCRALTHAIERAREIAPVECVWVPGNHDTSTSWYLVEWLGARFHADASVTLDNGPSPRKYHEYGVTLLGFTHGRDEKMNDLPLIMAAEQPEAWSRTTHHEIHVGHWHKKKELRHLAGDEFGGVRVRVIPPLSGTDKWHHERGYVKNRRAAEAYLWSREHGYTGHFSVSVRQGNG